MASEKSKLEREFEYYWRVLAKDGSQPVTQYRFHPERKWRFDLAWLDAKVAVELDGGIFSRGRHTRGMGYHNQLDKANAAIVEGWVVLRFDTLHLRDDPVGVIRTIEQVLVSRRQALKA